MIKGVILKMSQKSENKRDLTIDFLRGVVMFILIIIHVEIFSFYDFIVWERIGVISGGEGFVILSGLITGMVYKNKLISEGFAKTSKRLLKRAFQLYKVNIFIILSILFISKIDLFDASSVMTYVDRGMNKEYSLYGNMDTLTNAVKNVALLRVGPHQTQILGLYTVLMALAPFALYLISKNLSFLIVIISFAFYFFNQKYNLNITGCQFEYAFPILTWQVLFFNGMVFGANKDKITNALSESNKKAIFYVALFFFSGFFLFAQNSTNPLIPDYTKLHFIDPNVFNDIYGKYFMKNTLGFLRLCNYTVFLIVIYNFINKFKDQIYKYLGWFFIPIGQSTLYVFIFHVYFVMITANFINFGFANANLYTNTLAHSLVLGVLFLMVKNKFLFRFVPR